MTAIRKRVVSQLRNVAEELAQGVAKGLGIKNMPAPMPKVLKRSPKPEVSQSAALSLTARPGKLGIRTRRVAIVMADGIDGIAAMRLHDELALQGAVPRFVGLHMGPVRSEAGASLQAEVSLEAAPSVLWDAAIFPDGEAATKNLLGSGQALEFLKEQYRHCKPILVLGSARLLLEKAGIPSHSSDSGLLKVSADRLEEAIPAFIAALTAHRHLERETDPPVV